MSGLMRHIQGWGVYTPKRTETDTTAPEPVRVVVEAISENRLCTILLPNGDRKRVSFDSIKDYEEVT